MYGFRLNGTLAADTPSDADDVKNAKRALNAVGRYESPVVGSLSARVDVGPWPDVPVFEGLKRFQKEEGLRADGIARPGGPTGMTLRARAADADVAARTKKQGAGKQTPQKPADDPLAPSKRVATALGPGSLVSLGPPKKAKAGKKTPPPGPKPIVSPPVLALTGGVGMGQANRPQDAAGVRNALAWLGRNATGIAEGVESLQQAMGLKRDGIARLGGDTERTLNRLVAPLVRAVQLDAQEDAGPDPAPTPNPHPPQYEPPRPSPHPPKWEKPTPNPHPPAEDPDDDEEDDEGCSAIREALAQKKKELAEIVKKVELISMLPNEVDRAEVGRYISILEEHGAYRVNPYPPIPPRDFALPLTPDEWG